MSWKIVIDSTHCPKMRVGKYTRKKLCLMQPTGELNRFGECIEATCPLRAKEEGDVQR